MSCAIPASFTLSGKRRKRRGETEKRPPRHFSGESSALFPKLFHLFFFGVTLVKQTVLVN